MLEQALAQPGEPGAVPTSGQPLLRAPVRPGSTLAFPRLGPCQIVRSIGAGCWAALSDATGSLAIKLPRRRARGSTSC